jgi:hypothetical protein
MGMRRFTRLTNGFSKKVENHAHGLSLHFMHYNFCRPHKTLTKTYGRPTTPAMAQASSVILGRSRNWPNCSAEEVNRRWAFVRIESADSTLRPSTGH